MLQPLRDHHAMKTNVLAALHGRERQLLTVNTLRRDWEEKKARLAAAQLTPASQAKRVRRCAAEHVLLGPACIARQLSAHGRC